MKDESFRNLLSIEKRILLDSLNSHKSIKEAELKGLENYRQHCKEGHWKTYPSHSHNDLERTMFDIQESILEGSLEEISEQIARLEKEGKDKWLDLQINSKK